MDPELGIVLELNVPGREGVAMNERQVKLLRVAFLAGAITDAAALVPMLIPSVANSLWGFGDVPASYRFAMGYGASLMFGWTALLIWAFRHPVERRFVAAITALVIWGLVLTELAAVRAGALSAARMAPTWCLQGGLLLLFGIAYHYPSESAARRTP